MQRYRMLGGALTVLVLIGATPHITPTVVLVKEADLIKRTVPASRYFLRTVQIGRADFAKIRQEGGFEPDADKVKFFYGTDSSGKKAGVVLFPQVNTQHGPLEVGLTMNDDGTVRNATVTKATVETKPWIMKAVQAGLMPSFRGMRYGDDPARALRGLSADSLGAMPYYMAEVAASAVQRGLVYYDVLYARGS